MPISSFSGLNLSLRALLAEQAGLDTTAHNIANANTVGYTRQDAVFSASTPYQVAVRRRCRTARARSSARVSTSSSYQRVRDQFSDLQYRAQQMSLGQQQTLAQGLDQAQDLLSEPGDSGLQSMLSKFFDSWQTLANNPTSTAAQNAVLGQAKTVTDQLNAVTKGLTDLQANAAGQITNLLDPNGPVKAKADEIAQLNVSDRAGHGPRPAAQRPARPPRPAARRAEQDRLGLRHRRGQRGHQRRLRRRHAEARRLREHGQRTRRREHHLRLGRRRSAV